MSRSVTRAKGIIAATCHCGSVRVEVPRRPRVLTDCNCSICRRYGTLWAYYAVDAVRVAVLSGRTAGYTWRNEHIRFVRCGRCGCVTHWEPTAKSKRRKMGVNARNFEPSIVEAARIRRLDGADTWKYLD